MYLGMSQIEADADFGWRGTFEGDKMKAKSGWDNYGNGSNTSGFTALPGGYRHFDGDFEKSGTLAYFLSSTENNYHTVWCRGLSYSNSKVLRIRDRIKVSGFSVRCVKDN